MIAAQCGPAFDLEDVCATLGYDQTCIASSTDAEASPHIAAALANAVSRLRLQVPHLGQVRGMVAMIAMRSDTLPVQRIKELTKLLRVALPEDASVICAAVRQGDLASDVQVQLWARVR